MKKLKITFCCQECGYNTPKWLGRCPECGAWDCFVEERKTMVSAGGGRPGSALTGSRPVPIDTVALEDDDRTLTGISEFDRVLGGGVIAGSLVLIGGDPGIGKSTLLLQVIHALANGNRKILYVSGEESIRQIKMRSQRLGAVSSGMLVVSEIDIDAVLNMVDSVAPDAVVIDSIQTMYSPEVSSAPRQREPGAGGHHEIDGHGKKDRHPYISDRSCDQGRGHCRAENYGAHGGYGPVF